MGYPSQKQKTNLRQLIPLVLIGVGLILIGLVVTGFLSKGGNSSTEYSVVPSEVNFPAPDLTLNDLSGQPVNLTDYRHLILLVNNWATWCPPCKSEMPTLQKYFQEHQQQGFMLIGIEAGDSAEDVSSFIDNYKLTFPVLLDPNEKSLAAFRNDSLPSSYVIDHAGTVVMAWTGPISHAMLEQYLTPLLEK
jgi:cytochrome c biogenesis protein CcmG/thiol:disulfide interchange protein DsbE